MNDIALGPTGNSAGPYLRLRRDFFATVPLRATASLLIANSSILRPSLMSAVSHRGRAPRPAQVSPPGLRDFFATVPLRATASLLIANSSILRPSLMSAVSHRGRAPRPAQVSPPGPRNFGATLRPFIAERRPDPQPRPPSLSTPKRESCCSSSLRFSPSFLSISARSESNASTPMPLKFIVAIPISHRGWLQFDRAIQLKGKHARVACKMMDILLSRLRGCGPTPEQYH